MEVNGAIIGKSGVRMRGSFGSCLEEERAWREGYRGYATGGLGPECFCDFMEGDEGNSGFGTELGGHRDWGDFHRRALQ